MNDMFLLKDDGYGPVYIRLAAIGSVHVIAQSLRGSGGFVGDVEVRYISGSREFITDADWERIKPLLLADSPCVSGELIIDEKNGAALIEAMHEYKSQSAPSHHAQVITPAVTAEAMQRAAQPREEISPETALRAVIRVKRSSFYSKTTSSQRAMWTCFTDDGVTFNLFDHTDPLKDHKTLLATAGYLDFFQMMRLGDTAVWKQHPIRVAIEEVGNFWELERITPRETNAGPDEPVEELEPYQLEAAKDAKALLARDNLIVFDVETTGLGSDDEVVELAIIDGKGETAYRTLIKPQVMRHLTRPGRKGMSAQDIHGINEEMLKDAPPMNDPAVMGLITRFMAGKVWAAFNTAFDVRLLMQGWTIAHADAPFPEAADTADVQRLTNRYLGHEYTSLDESCKALGIAREGRHRADADARDALKVLQALAAKVPAEDPETAPF
jgi:DNA polymerase-3 subunit epsilon